MNAPGRSLCGLLWFAPILSAVVGCAGMPFARPIIDAVSSDGITERREQRNTEFVQQFEQNRDFAEFEAARAEWLRDDTTKCEQSLKRILTRNPAHRDALLLTAELCLVENRPDDALRHGRLALEAHPENAQVQYTMGLLLDAAGRSADALPYYERAVQLEPDNELYAVGHCTAFEAFESSGQPVTVLGPPPESHVRQTSLETSESPNNPQIPISEAVAALRHNQPALAVELLGAAEKQFPNSVALHRVLGAAHYRLGDYKSSQIALQRALSLDKSSALTYFLMGCTLAKLGRSEESEAHFGRARTLDPRYTVQR